MQDLLALDPINHDLLEELRRLTYTTLATGRILLTPKADLRKVLGRSPDQADALALAVGGATDSWSSGGGLACF